MSQKTHTQVFIRQNQEVENVAILVMVDRPTTPARTSEEAMEALEAVITQWVAQTPEGRESYEMSARDYNIGDFMHDFENPEVVARLFNAGFQSVQIDSITPDESQPFDRLLVDESELDL